MELEKFYRGISGGIPSVILGRIQEKIPDRVSDRNLKRNLMILKNALKQSLKEPLEMFQISEECLVKSLEESEVCARIPFFRGFLRERLYKLLRGFSLTCSGISSEIPLIIYLENL